MKKHEFLFLLSFISVYFPACSLQTINNNVVANPIEIKPFYPPTGFGIDRSNDDKVPFNIGGYTNKNETTNNWKIDQWSNPDLMTQFIAMPADKPYQKKWYVDSTFESVQVLKDFNNNFNIQLTQTGRNHAQAVPCTRPSGRPYELDLFVAPTDKRSKAKSGQNSAALADNPNKSPLLMLNTMLSLTTTGTFKLSNLAVPLSTDTPCEMNSVMALLAFIFTNPKTANKPAQVFYYQLSLFTRCDTSAPQKYCKNNNNKPHFWSAGVQTKPNGSLAFGMNDFLSSYTQPLINDANPHFIAVDILPRINEIISSGVYGLDTDLSHWKLSGMYYGQAIWGAVQLTTQWQGFIPVIKTKLN
jgi:hypothetical protein